MSIPDLTIASTERGLGEPRARERICIPCGIRTGFYKPGACCKRRHAVCRSCIKAFDKVDTPLTQADQSVCPKCVLAGFARPVRYVDRPERVRQKQIDGRRKRLEERSDAMREAMVDWGVWKRTGKGVKRRNESDEKKARRHLRLERRVEYLYDQTWSGHDEVASLSGLTL